MTLCRSQGVILSKMKSELQTFLKLVATLRNEGKISEGTSVEFIYRHHVVRREQLDASKEPSFPIPSTYSDVVRHTKRPILTI